MGDAKMKPENTSYRKKKSRRCNLWLLRAVHVCFAELHPIATKSVIPAMKYAGLHQRSVVLNALRATVKPSRMKAYARCVAGNVGRNHVLSASASLVRQAEPW